MTSRTNYKYLALLRGINVGGSNIIKMLDLKNCFESMGFEAVITYIQSGNVVFCSQDSDKEKLLIRIEKGLTKRFNSNLRIVLLSREELNKIVENAPNWMGNEPGVYRYDVVFLKWPLIAMEAKKNVKTKEGVDRVEVGEGVLYFSKLIEKATQSHLTKIIQSPIYQQITIRNWNTTMKLLTMMSVN